MEVDGSELPPVSFVYTENISNNLMMMMMMAQSFIIHLISGGCYHHHVEWCEYSISLASWLRECKSLYDDIAFLCLKNVLHICD